MNSSSCLGAADMRNQHPGANCSTQRTKITHWGGPTETLPDYEQLMNNSCTDYEPIIVPGGRRHEKEITRNEQKQQPTDQRQCQIMSNSCTVHEQFMNDLLASSLPFVLLAFSPVSGWKTTTILA